MNEDLEKYDELRKNKFLVIPNFLTTEEVKWSYDYFDRFVREFKTPGDKQCWESSGKYNFMPFVQILCNKTQKVSESIGVNVVPSYCYARKYYNGAELKRHVDRPACEISLSVHLEGDEEWALYVKGTPIHLKKGDAVLYWGMEDEHWRDVYTGEHYTNVFLHYVRLFGPHSDQVFDLQSYLKPQKPKKHYLIP